MTTTSCQLCGSVRLLPIIDLGNHPLADTFLSSPHPIKKALIYHLQVLQCESCGYTTLKHIVNESERYQVNDYSYTSSNSPVAVRHFEQMSREATGRLALTNSDLVVDIGSNDGTLLSAFRDNAHCTVVGVEPSRNIAAIAEANGIKTIVDFFNEDSARKIRSQYGTAKLITATNVFNHISDLDAFMRAVDDLLADDGFFLFETPYLPHLVEKRAFDTIYLEHISYFSFKPFRQFFKRFAMVISDFQENDYMGGSIRVYVSRRGPESNRMALIIKQEENQKIYDPNTYMQFMHDIQSLKINLLDSITEAKDRGGKVIGIGAATKGNTLLNYCGIDYSMLEYITDASPLKIGKFMPGSLIPIRSDDDIADDITHAVILPWNIADFLKNKLKHLKVAFIVPSITQKK